MHPSPPLSLFFFFFFTRRPFFIESSRSISFKIPCTPWSACEENLSKGLFFLWLYFLISAGQKVFLRPGEKEIKIPFKSRAPLFYLITRKGIFLRRSRSFRVKNKMKWRCSFSILHRIKEEHNCFYQKFIPRRSLFRVR